MDELDEYLMDQIDPIIYPIISELVQMGPMDEKDLRRKVAELALGEDLPPAQSWRNPEKVEELLDKLNHGEDNPDQATAGARSNATVKVGRAGFQLYSYATPNGQKIGILLEELGIDYDAWVVNLKEGAQYDQGFVDINPNSRVPCASDQKPTDGGAPLRLFESGAIAEYLADKYGKFIPSDPRGRAECMSWVHWQMSGESIGPPPRAPLMV
jgi:hypothetical protein